MGVWAIAWQGSVMDDEERGKTRVFGIGDFPLFLFSLLLAYLLPYIHSFVVVLYDCARAQMLHPQGFSTRPRESFRQASWEEPMMMILMIWMDCADLRSCMAGLRALHREDIHMIRGWNSIRYDTILTSPRCGMHVWFDMIAMDLDGSIYMVLRSFCIFVISCFDCDFICDLFCTIHLASATFRIVFSALVCTIEYWTFCLFAYSSADWFDCHFIWWCCLSVSGVIIFVGHQHQNFSTTPQANHDVVAAQPLNFRSP
ncbi:hypothetical protein B0J14DRAFT_173393 [Halenospora varia]|nr:hypothetical protein B0J14DRAFT_173393 [Halenospora varia]